jgi:polyisoprenoid-binding protein YceI
MRFRHFALAMLALTCAAPGVVLAALQASQAKVSFRCTGPGGLHIDGKGSELSVQEVGEALVVTVPLQNVSTGIGLRDTHMHTKYLEIAKYPNAELSVPRAGLQFPKEGETVDATAPGTMTIHGTSKPVTFHYKVVRHGAVYEVSGDVQLNMNDYAITPPNYLGITVKPPVEVAVTFQLLET